MAVKQKPKQVARVVAVDQKNGMTLISVQLAHSGGFISDVPVGKAAPGFQRTPEPGWLVVVDYLDDGSPYIGNVLNTPDYDMPELNDGSLTFRFNDGTHLTVEKQSDDTYNIDIEADGDMTVTAAGDVSVTAETATVETTGDATVKAGGNATVDVTGDLTATVGGKASLVAAGSLELDGSSIALGASGDALLTDVVPTKNSDGYVTDLTLEKTEKTSAE